MRCFKQDILNENCLTQPDKSITSFSGYESDNYADFGRFFIRVNVTSQKSKITQK